MRFLRNLARAAVKVTLCAALILLMVAVAAVPIHIGIHFLGPIGIVVALLIEMILLVAIVDTWTER